MQDYTSLYTVSANELVFMDSSFFFVGPEGVPMAYLLTKRAHQKISFLQMQCGGEEHGFWKQTHSVNIQSFIAVGLDHIA